MKNKGVEFQLSFLQLSFPLGWSPVAPFKALPPSDFTDPPSVDEYWTSCRGWRFLTPWHCGREFLWPRDPSPADWLQQPSQPALLCTERSAALAGSCCCSRCFVSLLCPSLSPHSVKGVNLHTKDFQQGKLWSDDSVLKRKWDAPGKVQRSQSMAAFSLETLQLPPGVAGGSELEKWLHSSSMCFHSGNEIGGKAGSQGDCGVFCCC